MRDRGFVDQLSDHAVEQLLDVGVRRRFPRRSYLYLQNDHPSSVFILEDGVVRIERQAGNGRSTLLDLMMPGELLGEISVLEARPRSAAAATVGSARLVVIPADRFLELFETLPEVARGTARWMSLRLRTFGDRFLEATHATAITRICTRLVHLMAFSETAPDQSVIVVLPVSQADLAEWAGLSREATVKALRELRNDGIVETARGRILVLRPDELRERAGLPSS